MVSRLGVEKDASVDGCGWTRAIHPDVDWHWRTTSSEWRTRQLQTHIADLVQHMETEDHSDVVLLAHSYGGMVATGAMADIGHRVRQIIYLDAVVPERGQSMLDTAEPQK
jgi:pimeloyl-ACP methyl ester carboxylesterase